MTRFFSVLGAVVLALIVVVPTVWATQIQYMSPQQLGAESALVVSGQVAEVRSYWNNSRTKIFTETRIDVTDSYKGTAGGSVNVIQLGGVVGNVRMTVHGALAWRPGEEVLVFLETTDNGAYQVSGFSQGKFRIERDKRGEPFVQNVPGDVVIVGVPGADGSVPAAPAAAMPLQLFLDRALGRSQEGGSR